MQTPRHLFSWLGLAGGLLVGLFLAAGLNALTYLATRDAPAHDGSQEAGFPLTFWRSGGYLPAGAPTTHFDPSALASDVLIAVAGAVGLGVTASFLVPQLSTPPANSEPGRRTGADPTRRQRRGARPR